MTTVRVLTIGLLVVAACVLGVGKAMAAETYFLVKILDTDRRVNYQVMSAIEFKDLDKTLQNEKKFYQDALRNAAKAWREDEFNKGIAFPSGRMVPRSIVGSPERFPSKEKAEEQLNKYYEREAEKESRLRDREKGKAKKSTEELARESKKESETSRAADLLREKLVELTGVQIEKPEAAPGIGEKKPDEKKVDEKKAGEKKVDEKKPGEKADPVNAAMKAL